jgi:hypothetical protein
VLLFGFCFKSSDKLVEVTLSGELDMKSDAAAVVHQPYMYAAGREGKHGTGGYSWVRLLIFGV